MPKMFFRRFLTLYAAVIFALVLPFYADSGFAQGPVNLERHYKGVSEKFCETRSSILNQCLDMSQNECERIMFDIYTECDNDNPEGKGKLIDETKFQECSDKKFMSYIKSKDIDPEAECTLQE